MKIIGFSINEIQGKRSVDMSKVSISTDIVFTEIEKSKLDVLKDSECLKGSFKFTVNYKDADKKENDDKNFVKFEGYLILATSKDESKDLLKSWKSKELPKDRLVPLYNYILKKCSVRALQLEEELNLQPHIPFPQVRANQQDSKN